MTQQDRLIKMRLGWFAHTKQVTGKVAKTCRHYGISRKTYYKWYGRYKENGSEALNDQSRGPNVLQKERLKQSLRKFCTSGNTIILDRIKFKCIYQDIII